MRTVIARALVDGEVRDEPSTYEAAEAIAGHRLDRRKNYAIIDGEVRVEERWSSACSGCAETPEGHWQDHRGIGCDECGYTGRRRGGMFLPLDGVDL